MLEGTVTKDVSQPFPTISQVKGARKIARNESDKIKAHQIKPRS